MAVDLQKRIAAEGTEGVLASLCEIRRDEPLGVAVLERYAWLGKEERWR
jgi:hypothetical protein